MLGFLEDAGFSFTDDEYEADVILVNTCCFIDDAKTESIETILEMAAMKTEGKCKKLVVSGCLPERYKDELIKELPEVDAYIGTKDLTAIVSACSLQEEETATPDLSGRRIITTPGHYEFLKIAEGCNKYCTYCIIPYIRGKYTSYPMDNLLQEAKSLAVQGVKELIIVAQETSIYGKDLYGKEMLPELLKKLCRIDGIEWIRLLYCYPEDITEEFLQVMAHEEKICHYIDMPIQHASDRILKKMGRKTDRASILSTIKRVR
jgi:ribosomal protein S12 methylthiotransferase